MSVHFTYVKSAENELAEASSSWKTTLQRMKPSLIYNEALEVNAFKKLWARNGSRKQSILMSRWVLHNSF
jgi:hypothetical protein